MKVIARTENSVTVQGEPKKDIFIQRIKCLFGSHKGIYQSSGFQCWFCGKQKIFISAMEQAHIKREVWI